MTTIINKLKHQKSDFVYLSVIILILCLNFIVANAENAELTCIDPNGKAVDWYVILLFPKTSEKSGELAYGYFDSSSTSLKYYKYDKASFPPLDFTYLNEYDDKSKTNFIFWNDDKSTEGKSDKASESKGHSKGGLIYNQGAAKYLLHSLPRFPRRTDDNQVISDLPDNAGIYGQHFLCITLTTSEALNIVNHLIIINPSLVYQHGISDRVGKNSAEVEKLLSSKADRSRDSYGELKVKSRNGKQFDLYSKGNGSKDLPYDAVIPNKYKSSIFVETWTKPEMLENICDSKYKVFNIVDLKFGQYEYSRNNEHSKWAVLEKKPVSCFGDLNRVQSQKRRGGFTICLEDANLANTLRKAIANHDVCATDSKVSKSLQFLESE